MKSGRWRHFFECQPLESDAPSNYVGQSNIWNKRFVCRDLVVDVIQLLELTAVKDVKEPETSRRASRFP